MVAVRVLAEQGNPKAQHNLGALYLEGRGVPRDEAQAAHWFLQAARQGDVRSQHSLGTLLIRGQGIPLDAVEAFRWFSQAAHQGDPRSQFSLGALYLEGQGVDQDLVTAHMWLCLAAEGTPPAHRHEVETVRDYVGTLLSPVQIVQARELAARWKTRLH
ncbi:MAG: sel1 repeat family protein [Magnetococcales bacterium]|nr:sel1 repeat family protein [Magnetococcales bacterium]